MRDVADKGRPSCRGFTVLEMMLVVAMMAAIAAFTAPLLSGTMSGNEFDAAVAEARDTLEEARSASMSGRAGGIYGVHFESGLYVLFEGEAYSPADPDNVAHELSGLVGITGIDIEGGGSDIVFRSVSGSPVGTGDIEFTDAAGAKTTVSVNEAGLVDVQ